VKLAQEGMATPPPTMLTVCQIATILNCSPRTVHRLADAGRIPPPFRLGGLVRWSGETIQAWIADGCPESRMSHGRRNSRN